MISDITYRIHCEEATSVHRRRQMRLVVHFNRLKPYRVRPQALRALSQEDDGVFTGGSHEGTALRGEVIEADNPAGPDSDSNDYSQLGTSRPGGATGGRVPEESDQDGGTSAIVSWTPLPQRERRPVWRRRAPVWATGGDYLLG